RARLPLSRKAIAWPEETRACGARAYRMAGAFAKAVDVSRCIATLRHLVNEQRFGANEDG
ncbi:hypothetical protein SB775_31715, partial [Peribacillus sp. SIMBA_075]|uniref:hypothetical protein n=1 Tax=Peribacillus sp. SIMBA_075 TaxID=3085813 RepID=UPI00397E14EF